jgi:hypothetical protein
MGKGPILIPSKRSIALALFFTSGLFLIIGLSFIIDVVLFKTSSTSTEGMIIRINENTANSTSYVSIFTYKDLNGNVYEKESIYSTKQPSLRIGDKAIIYYKNNNPNDSRIKNEIYQPLFPIVLIGISLAELLLGLFLIKNTRVMKKQNPNEESSSPKYQLHY